MLLDIRDESLISPFFERSKIVGHVTCQQHGSLGASHEKARVPDAVSWCGKRQHRSISGNAPTPRKLADWRPVEVEHVGSEAPVHRSHQRAKETSGKAGDRRPFRPGDPYALGIERREPPDVICVKMRQHYAVEVSRLESAARKFAVKCLLGRDLKRRSGHSTAGSRARACIDQNPFCPGFDNPCPHRQRASKTRISPQASNQPEWAAVGRAAFEKRGLKPQCAGSDGGDLHVDDRIVA